MTKLLFFIMLFSTVSLDISDEFKIEILRSNYIESENLIEGSLFLNGEYLGKTYERHDLRIDAGEYPGYMRYVSAKGFVVGPNGKMSNEGDFYLEVGEVEWSDGKRRSNLMFHGGNKAKHSLGCIMLGPVTKDKEGNRRLKSDHLLRILRNKFYGTEEPLVCPDKEIKIIITENF